jgi:hypothetical protein
MHWHTKKKLSPSDKQPHKADWHNWYAWKPVRIGPMTHWLEIIQRRWYVNSKNAHLKNYRGEWQYRVATIDPQKLST